jgi:hypothetical protein
VTTTTTTTFRLRAITDESIAKVHLGAVEKANRTWCGVDLLVKDDPRFGGRYKGIVYSASTDLENVNCGACKRSAAWKGRKGSTYAVPAPKAKAAPKAAAVHVVEHGEAAVSGGSVIEADPGTGLPRIKPEYAAKAEQVAADQAARNAG